MAMENQEIAALFAEMADYHELQGDNPFRVRAYRNAARLIEDMPEPLREGVTRQDDLTELPGIGKELAEKIVEIVQTGKLQALERLRSSLPACVPDLLALQGLGPRKVKALLDHLQITRLEDLEQAARNGKVRELPGFGAKTEASLLAAIQRRLSTPTRFLRSRVAPLANELMEALKKTGHVQQITVAGSFRRGRDTVGDLDLLAVSDHPSAVMQALVDRSEVAQVLLRGETKTSVRLTMGLQVDLRLVPPESFGAALQYFTGSQAHNIATRRRAQLAGLKQNEYGIFRAEEQIAGATEEEVYQALQLPWIPPELREDRGELALAEQGRLPNLIGPADIRGDLHNHSTWSDGAATLCEMACAARKRGWEYLAITDHSKRLTVANGLDEHRLRLQLEQMEEVRAELEGFSLLSGSEVDILEDGSLDLPDSILRELDVVILSVHSKFNLSREKQTTRILRALDNPYITFLAHPTGRLLLTRDPYEVDMERVLEGIRARGCFVECNLNPHRLDLDDRYLARAKALGVPVVLNCDGHSVTDFQHHDDGIMQARRAGLEAGDVVNTATITELRNRLRATKR